MKKEDLLMYEMPAIAAFVSSSWGQTIIARYTAWKVNRKWKRYQERLARDRFVKDLKEKYGSDYGDTFF